jgi:hypothetical protein
MERLITPKAATKLYERPPLPVDPRKSIAVKRDVHEYIVETDADAFADAFRQVMIDPAGTFGLIRVKRPADRVGADFVEGERFQGCYSIEAAVMRAMPVELRDLGAWLLSMRPIAALISHVEDQLLSDYAEIERLVLDPDRSRGQIHQLEYRYLEGTPIAGSSTFYIEDIAPGRCRVTQVFEYQEVNGIALATFQRFGLKMHDQVVAMQITRAAEQAGAPKPKGTIPQLYAEA